jgi:hypothetical protein
MAVTFSIQIPQETAVSITLSTDAVDSVTQFIKAYQLPFGDATTLALAALVGDTTMTLSSVTGLVTGMGLQIGAEVALVTGIAANVVTVQRARLGTTAAAYTLGTRVVFGRFGSYGEYITGLIVDQVRIAVTSFPSTVIASANAAIATQQAAISAAVAAAVTHVP